MKNRHLGILLVLAGADYNACETQSAWIISAILIGGGTEYFFGRIKLKVKKINKFFFINGLIDL